MYTDRQKGNFLQELIYRLMLTKMTAIMMKCREVMEKRRTELKGAE